VVRLGREGGGWHLPRQLRGHAGGSPVCLLTVVVGGIVLGKKETSRGKNGVLSKLCL